MPIVNEWDNVRLLAFDKRDKSLDFSDPRIICNKNNGSIVALTSLSHLKVARSKDGIHFTFTNEPLFILDPRIEPWGVEDPRITPIGEWFYVTFTSVSPKGAYVSLLRTKDFIRIERLGIILPPTNKDTVLFPETVQGLYWMLHRPSPSGIGNSDIWISESKDLLHWGGHEHLFGIVESSNWEHKKISAGAPPIKIEEGWLVFYHGVDHDETYSLGAVLLDAVNPKKIIGRTADPIMTPEMSYEREGFFNNTIFPCSAWLEEKNGSREIVMYYGASDSSICRADLLVDDILSHMK